MTRTAVAGMNSPLTEMAMGYFRSRALVAAARLGVADVLADGELTADEIAAACGADSRALRRLLRGLAGFGVLTERAPGRFALTPLGRPLRRDDASSAWPAIVFWGDLLADEWSLLTECVRAGKKAVDIRPAGSASRWSQDPDGAAVFRAVMGTAPAEDYIAIARAWDFSPYRTVADLGGGGGSLLAAILEEHPTISGLLVDRPESIERAAPRFGEAIYAGRCRLIAADLTVEIPAGAEVHLLKHVLHGYDDQAAAAILRLCAAALPPEGRILIVEFVLPDVIGQPDPDLEQRLMSDLNMLAVTGGCERSAGEWRELLAAAGLRCDQILPVPGDLVSIIEART